MNKLSYEQLEYRNLGYIAEIKRLQEGLDLLRSKQFRRFSDEECWIFDEDDVDGNHLESLVCPVVIRAKYLRDVLVKAARYEWIKANIEEEVTQRRDDYFALKTKYKLPDMLAFADFTGQIDFDDAVDIAMGKEE